MPTPQVSEYTDLLAQHSLLFVVWFRGHWCPFCAAYLSQLATLAPQIERAGGAVLAVTAEPEAHLAATRDKSGYQGRVIVDPAHSLAEYLGAKDVIHIATTAKAGYAAGMAQPGVLAVSAEETLFAWAVVPSMMNLGGATDRPELAQVWENVQAKLEGGKVVHAEYKRTGVWTGVRRAVFG